MVVGSVAGEFSGPSRGSTKKLFPGNLSGILRFGFRQNSIFEEASGDVSFGFPTEF